MSAQTNVAAASKRPTVITSDTVDFDLTARRAIYRGNVRLDDPQMLLTCVLLTADAPPPEENSQRKHIVAETNVIIISVDEKGQTNYTTSDKAVYDLKVENGVTNETVTWTGHAVMTNSQGTLTGEPIIWDRVKNHLFATDHKMVVNPGASSALTGTNSPPHKTNSPPGTIQNIDRIDTLNNRSPQTQ